MRVAYSGLVMLVTGAAVVWRARHSAPGAPDLLLQTVREVATPDDVRRLDALEALPDREPDEAFAIAVDQVLLAAALTPTPR